MRAAISLLVLLLSMCGVQTESHGTDVSTQNVSAELRELRDMVMVLRSDNVAMKTEVDNLKKENAAQEAELTALKTILAANQTEVENLVKEIKAAPKVAFSAGLTNSGYTEAGSSELNLVFSNVITNVGEAYSSTTGFFTAPVRGVYYLRFTVRDNLSSHYMFIIMHKNGKQLMKLHEYDTDREPSYLSSGLTLQLEKGDTVNMVLPAGKRIYDDASNYSTFSGFLLFPL
ncbi:complement C1q-like protein 2 [Engraulis encrasicolus]|uniref:complement C1q-like protein 2 n=1 Tax=Engraulis encrasicolus TaxID=184585 RepID=UPI002FD60477